MGIATKDKIKRFFKRIGLGVIDSIPIASTIRENIKSELNGEGKIDWLRLAVSIMMIIALLAFITGQISFEDFKQIIKIIK